MTSVFYPARVALLRHREFTEVRIRAGRERAHLRFLNPGTISSLNPARTRISNPLPAILPFGSGNWRTAIERTQTPIALAVRRFISRGPWLICNLRGAFSALRSLLSFSLVPVSPKTTSSIFQTFSLAPVLSFVPINHAHTRAWRRSHEVRKNSASGASNE